MATPDLTTAAQIERIFTTLGVDLRTDDQESPEDIDIVIAEVISWASTTIASYTLKHYDTEELVNNPWVQRRAAIICCYYLSQRRGNPPQFVAEYKRILEELELVNENKIMIPDAIVRAADVPCVHSHRVDDRYFINKLRVVKSQSTNPYPGQPGYDIPYITDSGLG